MTRPEQDRPDAYEKVTYRPEGGRSRSVYLHQPVVSGQFLTGIEVTRSGDDVASRGFDERRHVIETALITKREPMVMDRIYGELVPAGQATQNHGHTPADEQCCLGCGHHVTPHRGCVLR